MSLRAVSLPLLLLFAATTRAACYFPDGGLSSLDVPCDDTASESFCCFGGQACLSNKLCYDPTTLRFARGTCTDPNWESAACPKFCLNAVALGNPVFSCNTSSSDSYCCNNGCGCASSSTNEVHTFTGTPYTMTIIGSPQTFANPSSTISTSSLSTPSSAAATLSSSGSGGSSTSSTTKTMVPSATTSSTSGSSPPANGSSNTSNGVKIGVGVAAGAIVLAVAAVAFLRWGKMSKAMRASRLGRAPTMSLTVVPHNGYAVGTHGQEAELSAQNHSKSGQYVQELGTGQEGRWAELPAQRNM